MIEKIVENWLTKSSERSYQLPFSFLLMQEGKTVIHLTRHCGMEHGKDIIALDENGVAHAYQLKGISGSRLKLSEWQGIYNQILQLIFTPCIHPSIQSTEYHKSYLVLNGDIDEEVQAAIKVFNDDWEKKGQPQYRLEVIVKGQILSKALAVKDQFIPSEVQDFKSLLEFFLESGEGFLDKDRFSKLLLATVESKEIKSENEFHRLITSNALLCSLAITAYSNKDNHLAIVEAWTIYIMTVFRIVETTNRNIEKYDNEIALAKTIIVNSLSNLYEEAKEYSYFILGALPTDSFVYKNRTTIVLGMLANLGFISDQFSFDEIDSIITTQWNETNIWGETAIPYFLSMFFYYQKMGYNDKALALLNSLINKTLAFIVNPEIVFTDIYTSAEESILRPFSSDQYENHSPRLSYVLESLLILASRPPFKSLINSIWREITYCQFVELKLNYNSDYYLWRIQNAEEVMVQPELTKSWNLMMDEAKIFDIQRIPTSLLKHSLLIPLFWTVYPHRLNTNTLKWFTSTNGY